MLVTQPGTGITGVGIGVVFTASILSHLAPLLELPDVQSGVLYLRLASWEDGLGLSVGVW